MGLRICEDIRLHLGGALVSGDVVVAQRRWLTDILLVVCLFLAGVERAKLGSLYRFSSASRPRSILSSGLQEKLLRFP